MFADRLRLMALGRPKAGKTGMVACLLNAGFRVDLNPDPLLTFGGDHADTLSIIPLRDKMKINPDNTMTFRDEPQALRRAHRSLDDWGKIDPAHPWGPANTWGPDTVLLEDSLTGFGDAAFHNVMFINNRQPGSIRDLDWGSAMRAEDQFLSWLTGPDFHCHLIVTAHLKMIGPKAERYGKDDDPDLVKAKDAISVANAENMPTRYYPSALGRALPQEILRRVPASVLVEQVEGKRWIFTSPPDDMPIDIGVPIKGVKPRYPQETGLLDIMEGVCGYRAPPKSVAP
jgi:hypothetical protein